MLMSNWTFAQARDTLISASGLKKLSLEELMSIEVTSVSMRPEKLTEVASAIQVITGEDIRRSGVIRLPRALQLASNLQIGQANAHDWAVTSRGFNGLPSAGGILANKLLVMIDGRSIYNPLFGGVYWDVQNTVIEDVDRIEVVSGPGGTLWGANAVNGVINIVTKSAKETQGLYVSGAKGNLLKNFGEIRVGGRSRIDKDLYYRMYVQHFDHESTMLIKGVDAKDAWKMLQGGFRMDYYLPGSNTLTLQGDAYDGEANRDTLVRHTLTAGQNLLARFTHKFSDKSDLKVQGYFDRTWRHTPNSVQRFFYVVNTYDLDIQHRFPVGTKHSVLYGFGYRVQEDKLARSLSPLSRIMPLYSGFLQDEITLVPKLLKTTIGTKLLHNVYTGIEYQPSVRMAYTPGNRNTVWASVSRAVRTPTRFDADIVTENGERVAPEGFKSERVIAYELGYRTVPVSRLSLSFSTFFNHYDDVRSLDTTYKGKPNITIILANSQRAESWGFEFFGNYQANVWWRLRGGYTYFDRTIWAVDPAVRKVSVEFESVDPKSIVMLQSIMDLPGNLSLDIIGRYVDDLPAGIVTRLVPAYFTFDVRLAWKYDPVEISIAGLGLLEKEHIEVGPSKIPRTIYGRITCQL